MVKKAELDALQIRCTEAEKALESCNTALELIPLWALEQDQQWHPSENAIFLLKKARSSVALYAEHYWDTGNEL